ncbi:hypothetical protein PSACC_03193 [Paramicrosporidium saccamoebae]|uniref:AAA+ ATPase domain-containing protein n=1 Tax=Paramicrosporidium saccamoebae TaxID=1246581 RepID=A0A2H9TGZ7_9FUNG|nr:hypothetical protein PSACC_03193 [Paramicrosporidium saccamoebae]
MLVIRRINQWTVTRYRTLHCRVSLGSPSPCRISLLRRLSTSLPPPQQRRRREEVSTTQPNPLHRLRLRTVRATENKVDFGDVRSFPYGMDATVWSEWVDVARGTMTQDGRPFRLSKDLRGRPPITPALLLAYTGTHGEVLLKTVAMGLAKALAADFLAINAVEFAAIIAALNTESRTMRGMPPKTDSTDESLVEFVGNETLFSGSPMRTAFFNRPTSMALRYAEHFMTGLDGAASRRVIYVQTPLGLFQHGPILAEVAEMLTARRNKETGTLFIFSEGDQYDPVSPKGLFDLSMTMDPKAPLGEPLKALIDPSAMGSTDMTESDGIFSWMIDSRLRAPRIVVSPPEDAQALRQHQSQINKDQSLSIFIDNYSGILSRLQELSAVGNLYGELLLSLPTANRTEEIRSLLPSLNRRRMSTQEMTAFCLSVPLHSSQLRDDPVGLFAQSVDRFIRLRETQQRTVSFLKTKTDPKLETLTKHEKRLVSCVVTPAMVGTSFADIGALDSAKRTLHELISLRIQRPDYFSKGILRDCVSGILLFGPPGTGKTMLARAVAAQSGASFIAVNSSSIFDMYVGEDSRANSVGRASRVEIINEFMAEWDGLLSQNHGITVMAATNRPYALDDAVLRRLPRRILIDLPDAAARMQILALLLKDDFLAASVSLMDIALRCENYSGSDLKNMCMAAAMRSLRRVRAVDTVGVSVGIAANMSAGPTSERSMKSAEMTTGYPAEVVMEITNADFEGAMADVPASISDRMVTVHELRHWDTMYGEGRVNKSTVQFGFSCQ